jgi:hypothetical protein
MTQDEFEKLRARLEEQLRMDVEMLYEAHRVKLRAFETIRRAHAELRGEEMPEEVPVPGAGRRRTVLTLPSAVPAAPAPRAVLPPERTRSKAWSVILGIEEALDQVPEEFDKHDLMRALGYEPSRATLFRALETLRQEGIIALIEQGTGRTPSRFRKLPQAATVESGNTNDAAQATEPG